MSMRDLIPWRRGDRDMSRNTAESPILAIQQEMNRLFDDFFGDSVPAPFRSEELGHVAVSPKVNVEETESEFHVTAELPGMHEDDIDVSLHDGALVLRGEKKFESKSEEQNFHRVERAYGSFHRSIPIPTEIDADKVDAEFSNGVLNVTLPKTETSRTARKINVKKSK